MFTKLGIRHAALRFADEINVYDTVRQRKDRKALRKALYDYLMQECSDIIEEHLNSPEGSMTLDGVERIYNYKPNRSARLGTSGYHK